MNVSAGMVDVAFVGTPAGHATVPEGVNDTVPFDPVAVVVCVCVASAEPVNVSAGTVRLGAVAFALLFIRDKRDDQVRPRRRKSLLTRLGAALHSAARNRRQQRRLHDAPRRGCVGVHCDAGPPVSITTGCDGPWDGGARVPPELA